ncbi:transposase [Paracoccus sp. KCTC 42845]|uniref:Transposase n=1 Tax=Paracoccus aerius TaxID=1915382 RepID=A0ABS1S9I9_9RHOB|nr:transposase [Paracoccus aerius]
MLSEMPELSRMTAYQAASMAGVSPVRRDSDAICSCRMVAGGQQALQHALFQAALSAASHSPSLKRWPRVSRKRASRTRHG